MGWITIGLVVLVIFLLFLGLYFWASGPVIIADDEKAEIRSESPEEIRKQVAEGAIEDEESFKSAQNEFYHGADE